MECRWGIFLRRLLYLSLRHILVGRSSCHKGDKEGGGEDSEELHVWIFDTKSSNSIQYLKECSKRGRICLGKSPELGWLCCLYKPAIQLKIVYSAPCRLELHLSLLSIVCHRTYRLCDSSFLEPIFWNFSVRLLGNKSCRSISQPARPVVLHCSVSKPHIHETVTCIEEQTPSNPIVAVSENYRCLEW